MQHFHQEKEKEGERTKEQEGGSLSACKKVTLHLHKYRLTKTRLREHKLHSNWPIRHPQVIPPFLRSSNSTCTFIQYNRNWKILPTKGLIAKTFEIFSFRTTIQAPNFLSFFFFFNDSWMLLFPGSRSLGAQRRFPAINLHRSSTFIQTGGTRRGEKNERCSIFEATTSRRGGWTSSRERFFEVPLRFGFETFVKRDRGDGGAFYGGPKSKNGRSIVRHFFFFFFISFTFNHL